MNRDPLRHRDGRFAEDHKSEPTGLVLTAPPAGRAAMDAGYMFEVRDGVAEVGVGTELYGASITVKPDGTFQRWLNGGKTTGFSTLKQSEARRMENFIMHRLEEFSAAAQTYAAAHRPA